MTSPATAVGLKPERLSFARIAAAGLKESTAPQNLDQVSSSTHNITSDRPIEASESTPPYATSELSQKPGTQGQTQENLSNISGNGHPKPEIMSVQSPALQLADNGPLAAQASTENLHPRAPSSRDVAKPPSLDGKSVGSGATLGLDEKDSLRPDDSASVMAAAEEEYVFSPPSTGISGSHPSSDVGMRAFRQQLHEISALGPQARVPPGPLLTAGLATDSQGTLYIPPSGPGVGLVPGRPMDVQIGIFDLQPDPKLLEALESPRDRIWVLKLEQDIFDFVKDAKEASLNLPQCNAYHRMLAHKIADYYMLGHLVDESASVRLYKTPNCRIPPPLTAITTPSTAASTPPPGPPQMKILRRRDNDWSTGGNSNAASKTASENDESGTEDDRKKAPATREEREARYEAARLRIMGSAKPSDVPDVPYEADESCSSSANDKKNRRKQRSDSEDGFEARSAYSAYYTSSYSTAGYGPSPYGHSPYSDGSVSGQPSYTAQAAQMHLSHGLPNGAWPQSGYSQSGAPQHYWNASSPQTYDLSADFQRNMSLHGAGPIVTPPGPPNYNHNLGAPQYGAPPKAWSHQNHPPLQSTSHQGFGYALPYQDRPPAMSSQSHEQMPYPYGQLPSQTFPGRPPSKLEHPLPGSYKGKHFNPQSQTFVPAQASPTSSHRSYGSQPPTISMIKQKGMHEPRQRGFPPVQQPSIGHRNYQASPIPPTGAPHSSQPMVHPLPQPVFPRHPSPHAPLPAKPGPAVQRRNEPGQSSSDTTGAGHGQSSIARWGAPASLPAKPPPSKFDAAARPPIHPGVMLAKLSDAHALPVYPAVVNGSGTASSSKR